MKKCPYCAEEIQDEAIVCRYCGRELQTPIQPTPPIAPVINSVQQTAKLPKKKQPTILAVVAIFIVLCCALVFTRAMATNNPRVTPTASKVSEGANSVIMSTFTTVPSDTPQPTNTPVATRTPGATWTPAPTVDPYILVAKQKFLDFMDAFLDVNKYVQQAGDDVSLILDKDWKARTGLALGVLDFRADELAKLEPSPDYAKFHSYFVELAKETHLFTAAYARGIDNLDGDSVTAATDHLKNMTTLIENANLELDRIMNNQ